LLLDYPVYEEVTADERDENAGEEECNIQVSFPLCKPHINSLFASKPKLGAGMPNNDDSAGKLNKTTIRD
jgi:hypothetical protein